MIGICRCLLYNLQELRPKRIRQNHYLSRYGTWTYTSLLFRIGPYLSVHYITRSLKITA